MDKRKMMNCNDIDICTSVTFELNNLLQNDAIICYKSASNG